MIAEQTIIVTRAPMPWFMEAAFATCLVLAAAALLSVGVGMALMTYREWREYTDKRKWSKE